jgi:hypothetical protein
MLQFRIRKPLFERWQMTATENRCGFSERRIAVELRFVP